MTTILQSWLAAARRRHRERKLVDELLLLNDHLLADMGLRRDQLQPDGIHDLDRPTRSAPTRTRPMRRAVSRPSLQGCG